jgi:hypothetical protein
MQATGRMLGVLDADGLDSNANPSPRIGHRGRRKAGNDYEIEHR